ncbi:polyprenyl synthetase family protein, partial [Chloroflexota bacterium]
NSGKGIRPALTLLAGTFYNYNFNYLLPMAVSVELMHTATLVHDDAIDKSIVRRGQPTINKLWGEDTAILMGDYLFAKAGEFVSDTNNIRTIKLFSQTLGIISSGELNQYITAFKLEQTREQYFQRISGKTASLFCLSTESGAILSEAPEEAVKTLKDYGYNLGIAFQIVDDVFDFVSNEETLGKPVGSDLEQGTLTLPAMLLVERYPLDNPVKSFFETRDENSIKLAIDMVRDSSIINDCYTIASEYCARAKNCLESLPESPSMRILRDLADFIIDREE